METEEAGKKESPKELSKEERIKLLKGLDRLELDVEQELESEEIEKVEAEEDLRSIDRIRNKILEKRLETALKDKSK